MNAESVAKVEHVVNMLGAYGVVQAARQYARQLHMRARDLYKAMVRLENNVTFSYEKARKALHHGHEIAAADEAEESFTMFDAQEGGTEIDGVEYTFKGIILKDAQEEAVRLLREAEIRIEKAQRIISGALDDVDVVREDG